MPQKLTTTACFIQDESSGGKFLKFLVNTPVRLEGGGGSFK